MTPPILAWGVDVVLWWQQFHPLLDGPFRALTLLGEAVFQVALCCALYWAVDRRLALRLAALLILSGALNGVAKLIAAQPRPFQVDPRVMAIVSASSGGWPSGHTQSTVVVWGYLALTFRRGWLWALAATLVVLVPLSRIYLGVHFPTDLAGGFLLGALILWVFWRYQGRLERAWIARPRALRWAAATAVLTALCAGYYRTDARVLAAITGLAGVALGAWLSRTTPYPPERRLARLIVGFLGLGGLGIPQAFVDSQAVPIFVWATQAALAGLWLTWGAPSLAERLPFDRAVMRRR